MTCQEVVECYMMTTPIGEMLVKVCPQGLHSISQINCISDATFVPQPRKPEEAYDVCIIGKLPENKEINKHVEKCCSWLRAYFMDAKNTSVMPIPNLCSTSEVGSFNEKVWLALAKNVGPGKTVSYAGLAKLVNSPGASQAVGNAMAANPFQILVPCHRVIRSDGSMGQYSRGKKNAVKKWLLEYEGLKIANNKVVTDG